MALSTGSTYFDPASARSAFYKQGQRGVAADWSIDVMAVTLAEFGMINLFVGPGPDPTSISGYNLSYLWLERESGVTDAPGTLRKYQGSGTVSSKANWPVVDQAALIQHLGSVSALAGMGTIGKATLAELNADLAHDADTLAMVYADGAINSGIYRKNGASGTGTWTRITDLPFQILPITITGGTADAIVATTVHPVPQVDRAAILILTPSANNTGPVTLDLNGSLRDLVDDSGAPLLADALSAGRPTLILLQSGDYRLTQGADILAAAAAADASAAAAATSATNAATSETNAAASETAAATSATNAATSATAASTSATNAATSATNAATSETNAAASEAAASTSATNAATSATNAATSETNAATSETNAATSETNAATSETNAAASETAAGVAAFLAMAYSGIQINGDMVVSQEHGVTSVGTGQYPADQWLAVESGGPVLAYQRVADAPDDFRYSIKCTTTTPSASGSASLIQNIEGTRIYTSLNPGVAGANPFVIGFWLKSSLATGFTVAFRDSTNTWKHSVTATLTSANVWQYFAFLVPASSIDDGTWGSEFAKAGSFIIYAGLAGGQVGIMNTLNATMQLTGVTITPGTYVPTSAESAIMARRYSDSLRECQRYFWRGSAIGSGSGVYYGVSGGFHTGAVIGFPESMRAVPTMSIVTVPTYLNCTHHDLSATVDGALHRVIPSSPPVDFRAGFGVYAANARL